LKKTPKCALPSATEAFKHAGTTEMKLFLEYRIRNSRTNEAGNSLRRSTVQGTYKTEQMTYYQDTKRQLPRETNDAVNLVRFQPSLRNSSLTYTQHILTYLTEMYKLIVESKDKPTCSVIDLYNLLAYHWCEDDRTKCHGRFRVQTAFLMQLIAYTSSRLGAIIEQKHFKSKRRFLKYKVSPLAPKPSDH